MNLLLDTQVLIWLDIDSQRLPNQAIDLLLNHENTWYLSIASVWEMQIKLQLGKLTLNYPLPDLIASQQRSNNLQLLPIELIHIFALQELPNHHRDPFDRLLIAQAIVEGIPVLSADKIFDGYSVQRLWD